MEAFDSWVRVGSFAVGFLGVVAFFQSILRVALLHRRQGDWLATSIGKVTTRLIKHLARRRRDYEDVQRTMDWAFPIYNLTLAGVWFLLVQTSFALMIWALEVDRTWLKSFIASGSALSTLGFATPSNPVGQLLSVLEGAVGLGIVVFILGFIPGYRSAVEVRENSSWMVVHARWRAPDRLQPSRMVPDCGSIGRHDADLERWGILVPEPLGDTLAHSSARTRSIHLFGPDVDRRRRHHTRCRLIRVILAKN